MRNLGVKQSKFYKADKWLLKRPVNTIAKENYDYYFSLPLFSVDKQYVILKELYSCGHNCGEYRIMLYKKTKFGWAFCHYLLGGVF